MPGTRSALVNYDVMTLYAKCVYGYFASIGVSVLHEANGQSLRIECARTKPRLLSKNPRRRTINPAGVFYVSNLSKAFVVVVFNPDDVMNSENEYIINLYSSLVK